MFPDPEFGKRSGHLFQILLNESFFGSWILYQPIPKLPSMFPVRSTLFHLSIGRDITVVFMILRIISQDRRGRGHLLLPTVLKRMIVPFLKGKKFPIGKEKSFPFKSLSMSHPLIPVTPSSPPHRMPEKAFETEGVSASERGCVSIPRRSTRAPDRIASPPGAQARRRTSLSDLKACLVHEELHPSLRNPRELL